MASIPPVACSLSRGLAAASALVLAVGAGAAATPLPTPGFPQSLGVQLKPDSFNIETLEKAHAMGFRVVRRGFYWNGVEKERGVYAFDAYDAQMARAKELGIVVVGCLFSGNKLYEDHGRGGVLTEEGRKGFAAFAAAAAARYKDQPVVWEIWNEPNVRTFWRKDGVHNTPEFADEYSALVNTVVPEMLKANPECFVVAGSVSNYWEPSYQWTEYCFQRGVLKSGIRGWSVHPYGVRTPEEHAIGHARTRELLVKYGAPDLPMVNTERGYSVKETAEGWSGGSKDRAREFQAWHFARQALVDQLSGVVFSVWYEWGGEEFGLSDSDGPRPIQAACRKLAEELNGYRVVRRLESDSAQDYILLCESEKGDRKLAGWTSPPPGGQPDEAWPHEVALELGAGGGVLSMKLAGEPQYRAIDRNASPSKSITTTPKPVPAAVAAVAAAGATDLGLFEPGATWNFVKNTGEGSFELAKDADGKAIGVLSYDFSKSQSRSTPYVLASAPISAGEGTSAIQLYARSAIAQPLTFRVTDATGQTLQFKMRLKGKGTWEEIRIPLNRKLEHWDGANDGFAHFPLKSIVFSVPKPGDVTVGKVEYASVAAVGGGVARPQPAAAAAPAPAPVQGAQPAAVAQPGAGVGTIKLYDAATGKLVMTGTLEGGAAVAAAPAAPAVAAPAIVRPAASLAPAAAPAVAVLEGELALGLFDGGTAWNFVKNTGEGSFTLAKDPAGKGIGVLAYDFTKAKANSTPYVLASAPLSVPAGKEIALRARTAVAQKLTFRVTDSTGQTLQYKTKTKGGGAWEEVRIPLNKKLEHWDGANDGFTHFPLKSIVFSVPQPGPETLTGTVEYTAAVAR